MRLGGAHRGAIDRHHVLRAGGEDNVGMLSRPARTMRGSAGCGNQIGTAALLPGSSGLNGEKLNSALFRNLCGSSASNFHTRYNQPPALTRLADDDRKGWHLPGSHD